ncbi:MAG: glycosyltransferase [Thermoguttaceae bacterium]|jgi:tetratricopeptide (TPR) repeat protein
MKIFPQSAAYPRLTVAMIVANEQDVLAESVDSVRPIADEVVILDTGSTDETPQLAQRLGARVQQMPWANDFAAARNRCLEAASGDFVLWLDAGERVAAESAGGLREFIDQKPDPRTVYSLWVEVPPADSGGSAEQIAQPRLIPRAAGLRFQGRVRETLWPAIRAAGLETAIAATRIIRHPRQHDCERSTLKAKRNLSLALLEAAETAVPPPRILLALGEAHSVLGSPERAREAFAAALRSAERGSAEMLEAHYGLLTTLDDDPQQQTRRVTTCRDALEVFPFDMQLLLAMGNYLLGQQRQDLAIRFFDAAVRWGATTPEVWHLKDIQEAGAVCLSLALQGAERDEEAGAALQDGLRRHPDSLRIQQHLLNLDIKKGWTEQALAVADRMTMDADARPAFREAVRGACKAGQGRWSEALAALENAYRLECRSPLCLRWLSFTHIALGQNEAARPILQQWQQLEPHNAEAQTCLEQIGPPPQDLTPPAVEKTVPPSTRHRRIDPGTSPGDRPRKLTGAKAGGRR